MTVTIDEVLHAIGQGLRLPCLAILLLLMAAAVWQAGDLLAEALTQRRKLRCDVPALLLRIHGSGGELEEVIRQSGLLPRHRDALLKLAAAREMPRPSLTALAQRLLATEEARCGRATAVTDTAAKLGPMFGLLGTLIPLGPGIVALGRGDTAALAASMGTAFDTTIAGLISAAVCLVISGVRRRWYDDDLVTLETAMDCVLEEVGGRAA